MTANTWYDKGYNEGYEAAAKVAREQYALVDYWTDKVASLQAENARLRDALRPFANAAESMHSFTGQRYQGVDEYLPIEQGVVDEAIMNDYGVGEITVGDLQQASAALADVEQKSTAGGGTVSEPIFDAQRAERIKLLSDAINKNGVSINDNLLLFKTDGIKSEVSEEVAVTIETQKPPPAGEANGGNV